MQCNGTTKKGTQCKANATSGEFCKAHQEQEETPEQVAAQINKAYDIQVRDTMGNLHNAIVDAIKASDLPIPYSLIVLDMLRDELVEAAKSRYRGHNGS